MRRVLFVCTANVDRSRTAMDYFRTQFSDIAFSSAGTDEEETQKANTCFLTQELIEDATLILVMEARHRDWMMAHREMDPQKVHVLGIPDNYRYFAPDLIRLLEQKCSSFF
jgi:predicted protein tyrosine phosphatase